MQTVRWRRLVESLFPRSQPRRALANLLAVVEAKFHGICPTSTADAWGKFWGGRYRNVGGAWAVQAYLWPPRLVVSAVVCLYLCESGVNSDVAVRMKPNAVRPSQRPRHIIVTGRRPARATGRSTASYRSGARPPAARAPRRRCCSTPTRCARYGPDTRTCSFSCMWLEAGSRTQPLATGQGFSGYRGHVGASCIAPDLSHDDPLDGPFVDAAAPSRQP